MMTHDDTKPQAKSQTDSLPSRKPGRPTSATGRTVTAKGYVLVKRNGRWIAEHKIVAEAILGRELVWTDELKERIIHKDGDKTNNVPENFILETTTRKSLL